MLPEAQEAAAPTPHVLASPTHHAAAEHQPHAEHGAKREHPAQVEAATPAAPTPHTAPVHPHLADAQLAIFPAVLKNAETYLAKAVASHITPALRDGLMLTLQSDLGKDGTTDVKLTFHGPMVGANAALLGKEVLTALEKDPLTADLFKGEHKPHIQKVEGQPDALQVHINHLSTAQYATLIQKLATAKTAAAKPLAEEAAAAPSGMDQLLALQAQTQGAPAPQVTGVIPQGMVANQNVALGAAS